MALFKLGAMFSAISGKVGGQSMANYGSFQVLKNITFTNKTPSPKQSTQRMLTAYLTNNWRQLTTAQQQGWSATASNYTYVNRVGDTITRNGYQTYCFCNQNLALISGTLIDTAPAYIPVVEPKINIVDISSGNFEIDSNNSSSDYLYALFGVANLSNGQTAQKGLMRFLGTITSAQLAAGYDVIADLETVFGALSFPNKIGITIDPINQTTGNRNQFATIIENIDLPMIIEITVSDGDTFTVPFTSGGVYSGSIDYGDGNVKTFSAYNSSGCSNTYTLGGVYNVLIYGIFPKFQVNNGASRLYLTDIIQFGTNEFKYLNFYNSELLVNVSCADTPNMRTTGNLQSLFRDTASILSFNNIENWDTSKVATFTDCFRGALNFSADLSLWSGASAASLQKFGNNADSLSFDINNLLTSAVTNCNEAFSANDAFNGDVSAVDCSSVTNFNSMFLNATLFNQSLASWDISAATNMTSMLGNTSMSDANWDATLNAWAALPTPPSSITISCKATHTAAANAAYTTLTTTYSWTITEGV